MNFIDGLNYQNYTTIDKTREITKKLVERDKKIEENYDSNEYELGIFKKSKDDYNMYIKSMYTQRYKYGLVYTIKTWKFIYFSWSNYGWKNYICLLLTQI